MSGHLYFGVILQKVGGTFWKTYAILLMLVYTSKISKNARSSQGIGLKPNARHLNSQDRADLEANDSTVDRRKWISAPG
jgi:hypothetical protein